MLQITYANDTVKKYPLPIPRGMNRADVYYQTFTKVPDFVLILCPGVNGNGKGLITSQRWKDFASQYNLGLMAISFASSYDDIRTGRSYYRADLYSGELLKNAISKIYGKDVKLLLYGFSGGAHFVAKFVDTYPDNVTAWVTYAAMWKDEPNLNKINPYGLIICGDEDIRLGAALAYFQKGRILKKPWLWLMVTQNGHSPSDKAEDFIKVFFTAFINNYDVLSKNEGLYVDINDRTLISKEFYHASSVSTGYLLNQAVYIKWRQFYE